jgi:rhodanese-related sulfurtransferase
MAKQKRGNNNWIGGYVLGVVSVALIFYVVWQISGREAPQQAAAPTGATAPVAPPPGAPPDDHDHAALEAEIAKTPRITAEELKALLDKDEAIVIDVRNVEDFVDGHIPGALQIPLSFVEGEIPWFPRDKKIVTYCTCPAEETSGHAVLILQRGGLTNAAALVGGLDTWRARGFQVDTGMPQMPE